MKGGYEEYDKYLKFILESNNIPYQQEYIEYESVSVSTCILILVRLIQ